MSVSLDGENVMRLASRRHEPLASPEDKPYTARSLVRDLLVSLGYTLVIVALVRLGVLKPVTDYFKDK